MNSVALRIQRMSLQDQVLVLAELTQQRADMARFAPRDVEALFEELALPRPARTSNVMAALEGAGHLSRTRGRGPVWAVSPEGRSRLATLDLDEDLPSLLAEIHASGSSLLGGTVHPLLPPVLAPPELSHGLGEFLERFAFETNVFGMTRFPEEDPDDVDPVNAALELADAVCDAHGLTFLLASARAIVDDLWMNVSAHMWASKYGIAFFEDRRDRGVNYNMTIEVGSMLITGRRCALLRDKSIVGMPTDLVGRIYRPVDLDDLSTVAKELHGWLRDDLRLGPCKECV